MLIIDYQYLNHSRGEDEMHQTSIDFNDLMSHLKRDEALIDSHYPRSVTELVVFLSTNNWLSSENLPCIPVNLKTEEEQIDFLFDNLATYFEGLNIERSLLHHVLPAAYGLYGYSKCQELAKTIDISLALNLEAIRGERGAFDNRLHSIARPYEEQENSALNTLALIEDSEFADDKGRFLFGYDTSPRCQDAICLRAAPQTHGGARDVFGFLKKSLQDYLTNEMDLSVQLRYALDLAMTSLADLGNISERRAFRLNDHAFSYGLPTNLIFKDPGYNHGFPVIQAVGTAVLGELKTHALPSRSLMNDDLDSTLAFSSSKRLVDNLGLLSKIMAIEVLMSCQGIDLVWQKLPDLKLGKGTQVAYQKIRQHCLVVEENRYVIPEINELDRIIFTGELLFAVENSTGFLK